MISKNRGEWHYAWVGAEVGELRDPLSFPGWADLPSWSTTEVGSMLARMHREDGSVTVDLRFLRDPHAAGLRAAVLVRVHGRSPAAVRGDAQMVLDLALGWALADMSPLDDAQLKVWLRPIVRDARWRWTIRRRILRSDGSMPDRVVVRPIVASTDSWTWMLDEMVGLPAPTIAGVRLRGCSSRGRGDVVSALAEYEYYARPRADPAAAALGSTITHPASGFAIDATAALGALTEQWSPRRFQFELYGSGAGHAHALDRRFEALAPTVPVDPHSAAFRSSALCIHEVSTSPRSSGFDARTEALDFDTSESADARALSPALRELAATVDEIEAASLFHLPRPGPPPTPGFGSQFEPATGIPATDFVFLSYNRRDRALVSRLARIVKSWNIEPWWDARIVADTDWSHELGAALADGRCRAVVVALTERTELSEGVRQEVRMARHHGRPIVEVMLRTAAPFDTSRQYVPLAGWMGNATDSRLDLLKRDLVALLRRNDRRGAMPPRS